MDSNIPLENEIRTLLIENLMLQQQPAELPADLPLFGPGSLGLDSVDALQLVVALDKRYGLKIADAAAAREILQSIRSIVAAVAQHTPSVARSTAGVPPDPRTIPGA